VFVNASWEHFCWKNKRRSKRFSRSDKERNKMSLVMQKYNEKCCHVS
jgi:hypothetical protein